VALIGITVGCISGTSLRIGWGAWKPRSSVYSIEPGGISNFLSLEVSVVDTTVEPMKELIEDLALNSDTALWLTPYRGIPAAPGMPPFDILYLDEDHRVVQEVESYPSPEVRPLNSRTASALVLPPHTIFGSKTLPGDQLDVRAVGEADEVECRRQLLSSRSGQGSVARRKESAVEEPTPKDGSAPTLSDDRSGRLQRAIHTLGEKEAEFHARQKGSLKTRFLRWLNSEPSDRRRAR
jgi:hypothetical protein